MYDGNEFLCLKFNLGRLISSQHEESQPRYRSITVKPRMLILANPTGDLKSSYLEGINIRNQLDKVRDKICVDFKSTSVDTLYVKKSLREYDIVHFAGHCECEADQPQETGWLLEDGRFTTRDILTMGADSLLPSLVFSNACQSARINKEGIEEDYQEKTYSLASAFIFSGVRHYIGSIRKIEDPVSFTFAREFYAHLVRGCPVGESIRLSRLRLVKDYGAGACFWASYILYGDPDFIIFLKGAKTQAGRKVLSASALRKHRKKLWISLLAIAILSALLVLAFLLPSLNPSSYYLLKKSQGLFQSGRNQEVTALLSRAVSIDPGFLAFYPLIADSYDRMGKRDVAQKYYFEYMLQSEKKGAGKQLADSYILIGWLFQQEGLYRKSYDFYQKAVALSRKNDDKLHEALALRKLALWHMDKGENETALRLLTVSSEINRERQAIYDHRYNLACDYFDLGILLANKQDYKAAREFYDKSLRTFNQLNLKNEISDFYFNIGEICLWEKQYQKALDNYLKGLDIDRAQANTPSLCSDYNMIGELYLEMNDLPRAEDYFKKSETLALEFKGKMELAEVSYDLGVLYKAKNQKDLARQYLSRAREIYAEVQTPEFKAVQDELLSLDR